MNLNDFQIFARNPAKFVMENMGISADIANDPNKIIQHLMNTGRINQDQYNAARNAAGQFQNNPMIQQILGVKR